MQKRFETYIIPFKIYDDKDYSMSVASKKNVLAYVLALTVVVGALFTLRHRISFFNSSSVTFSLDQLTETQVAAQKYFELAKEGDALAMNALGHKGNLGK
jgi:hypothetical protein